MPISEKTDQIAKSLDPHGLPSVAFGERNLLPELTAIYFLLDGARAVLYVGTTRKLNSRWRTHQQRENAARFPEARISWLDCDPSDSRYLDRLAIERGLIQRFRPPFNRDPEAVPAFSCAIARESLETLDLLALSWGMSRREALEKIIGWADERDAAEIWRQIERAALGTKMTL